MLSKRLAPKLEEGLNGRTELPPNPVGCACRGAVDGADDAVVLPGPLAVENAPEPLNVEDDHAEDDVGCELTAEAV
jgi:hypothetical protein